MSQGNQLQISFCFCFKNFILGKSKWSVACFTTFRQLSNQYTIETSCLKLYTIDLEIYSISNFQIRVWEWFPQYILRIIFQEKCSACCILLTDQISLSGSLCFLTYWTIFLIKPFLYMHKNSRQKLKYLKNEMSF